MGAALVILGQTMLLGLGLNITEEPPILGSGGYIVLHGLLILSVVATFFLLGGAVFGNLLSALRRGRLTVEALFVGSLLGALVVSLKSTLTGAGPLYYEVVSTVLIIYTFGNALRQRAFNEAQTIVAQARQNYATALKLQDGQAVPTTVDKLCADDLVVIKPGQMSTVDGIITQGRAFVTLASITGEPAAVPLQPGDHLPAGAFSVDGLLTVRVTSTARSVDAVFEQLTSGAPSRYQDLADRVTAWFLPVVGLVALAAFVGWSFVSIDVALTSAMSVLLVACPCALGMATPLAVQSVFARLGQFGWRARSGQLIERLAAVDTVFFDKTGTLTLSDLRIADTSWQSNLPLTPAQVQGLVALAQQNIPQPIARAFDVWQPLPGAQLKELRVHPGQGIQAALHFNERTYLLRVGRQAFAQETTSGPWPTAPVGKRLVFVALDHQPAGIVSLVEASRPQTDKLLEQLRARGLRVEVLTGDPQPQISLPVPIHAGLSPDDKARRVADAQTQGAKVLFVGDGLNDAPALTQAFCSVAVAEGAPLTHAAATAVVDGAGIEALPHALELSQKASAALAWNLRFAAVYNFLGIVLAALGVLHPVAASFLMLVSSMVVAWRSVSAVAYPPGNLGHEYSSDDAVQDNV